jgi:hypothetical protein
MGLIFQNTPKEGEPLSRRGLARGLRKIERILENLSASGLANLHRSGDFWNIEVYGDEGGEGADLPPGGEQYQVLQRDSNNDAVWDWVRWP